MMNEGGPRIFLPKMNLCSFQGLPTHMNSVQLLFQKKVELMELSSFTTLHFGVFQSMKNE